jgi:hypothetical protein
MNEFNKAVATTEFTSLSIESDGTRAGTVIKVNGKEVKNASTAYLSFYNDEYGNAVTFEFSTVDGDRSPGTLSNTTYWRLIPPVEDSAKAAIGDPAQKCMDMSKLTPEDLQKMGNKGFNGRTLSAAGAIVQGGVDVTRHMRGNALRTLYGKM